MTSLSILRRCKFKKIIHQIPRILYSDAAHIKVDVAQPTGATADANLVEVSSSWPAEEVELRTQTLAGMRIFPDFISEEEEASLLAEVEPQLKRLRYEYDHWDNGYRETERELWSERNAAVFGRVRACAFVNGAQLLPRVHVLDLAAAGHIRPHVDAVRFCGDTIAGLCLLSSAVMRLVHCDRAHLTLDALLQRRSLYVMSGVARYQFTHEVLGGERSVWCGQPLPRRRRVALICRERPREQPDPTTTAAVAADHHTP